MSRGLESSRSSAAEDAQSSALISHLKTVLEEHSIVHAATGQIANTDADLLDSAGDDLTDLLRWERRYLEAISLQHRLTLLLPEHSRKYRVRAATFAIETGAVEQGLRELQREATFMDPAEGKLLMASTLTWLQQHEPAETLLRDIISDNATGPSDRAAAAYALFQVLSLLPRLSDAVEAWQLAAELDPTYDATLPELIRAQVYWRDFDGALKSIAKERNEVRRSFFRELINARTTAGFRRESWDWVSGLDAASIGDAREEFADAALRNISPQRALDVLMPLVDRKELSRATLMLTGLAWAQLREVERARWALHLALRMAEIERPRRTRQGAGALRIFDAETRISYGEIPIDTDVRAYLDHFFMPKPEQAYDSQALQATSAA